MANLRSVMVSAGLLACGIVIGSAGTRALSGSGTEGMVGAAQLEVRKAKPVREPARKVARARVEEPAAAAEIPIAASPAAGGPAIPAEAPVAQGKPDKLEQLRLTDPEAYAREREAAAQKKARKLQKVQNVLDVLGSVDATRLTPEQREAHEQLQTLIARRAELKSIEKSDDPGVTPEQRRQAKEESHAVKEQIKELNRAERATLLSLAASDFGCPASDLGAAVETLNAIVEATAED